MITTRDITYDIDGKPFIGYLADGSRGNKVPGVLLVHEARGLTGHTKMRARMLAELGFVAFAMDNFGDGTTDLERAMRTYAELKEDRPTLRKHVTVAFDFLTNHSNVDTSKTAAIGFCFGGTTVLELARSGADVGVVVGFHSELGTKAPQDAKNIRAKVLVCLGADDPLIPPEQREAFINEMTAGEVDWQMNLYGGVGHSFTNREVDADNSPGFKFDAVAEQRSWASMRAAFDEAWGR